MSPKNLKNLLATTAIGLALITPAHASILLSYCVEAYTTSFDNPPTITPGTEVPAYQDSGGNPSALWPQAYEYVDSSSGGVQHDFTDNSRNFGLCYFPGTETIGTTVYSAQAYDIDYHEATPPDNDPSRTLTLWTTAGYPGRTGTTTNATTNFGTTTEVIVGPNIWHTAVAIEFWYSINEGTGGFQSNDVLFQARMLYRTGGAATINEPPMPSDTTAPDYPEQSREWAKALFDRYPPPLIYKDGKMIRNPEATGWTETPKGWIHD